MKKLLFFYLFLFSFISLIHSQESGLNNDSIKVAIRDYNTKRDSVLKQKMKEPYPDFIALSLSGEKIARSQLKGKIVLINFWFESCAPCVAEFDALSELYAKNKDNPDFLFLSFTFDPIENAKKTALKYKLPYIVCPISRDECSRLNLNSAFPTTIILDKDGMIDYHKQGGSTSKEGVAKQVDEFEKEIIKLLF